MNYAQIKDIEQKNKERILRVCPTVNENSGIYSLTREEDGFKYAYVGQSKHILTRLVAHLKGYQHIDLSIKKHGLYSESNLTGWQVAFFNCPIEQLDEKEMEYISEYAKLGFQLRNKTSGSQGEGKFGIADNKPAKGYYDGLRQGYKNARKGVANWFNKWLAVTCLSNNKNAEKALDKFTNFINIEQENENE